MADAVKFVKLSGSGNDFICMDNLDGRFDKLLSSPQRVGHFARALCHRGVGIGADGIIFASKPDIEGVSHIAARFFEANGCEAELCGNGAGCFVHWASEAGWVNDLQAKILTPAGVVIGTNSDHQYVRVCIPDPQDVQRDLELTARGRLWKCDYAVTGVPHVVAYVDNVETVDIAHWGPALRHHRRFSPRGANANFVQIVSEGLIAIRTWEFGVENETLSCGTGSAAAAILAATRFDWPRPYLTGERAVLVRARSGDVLKVYFVATNDGAKDVCLETVVRFLCYGTVHPDLVFVAINPQAVGPTPTSET